MMPEIIPIKIELKTADEMFKEIGWKKIENTKKYIIYTYFSKKQRKNFYIEFDLISKEVKAFYYLRGLEKVSIGLKIKELKAINKKCKELGWI